MKPWHLWAILLFTLCLSSCKPATALPTPLPGTQPPDAAIATQVNLQYQNLAEAQARWQAHGPKSYSLTIRTVSLWHVQTIRVQVQQGKVVTSSAECQPAPMEGRSCQVAPYVAEDYLVPALFAKIETALSYPGSEAMGADYDASLGYPLRISFDDPQAVDEEWLWEVLEFQSLE